MTTKDQNGAAGIESVKQSAVSVLTFAVIAVFATQLGKIYVEPGDAGLGARGLPDAVLILGTFLAGIQLARNLPAAVRFLSGPDPVLDWFALRRLIALTALAFAYVWAITLFQYALPTLVALSVLLYLFGSRGIIRLVVVPVCAVAIYYVLFFVLLGVFENPGTILQYDSYTFAYRLRQLIGLQ